MEKEKYQLHTDNYSIYNADCMSVLPTLEKIEEKYNDILVYFLIEKAMIIERLNSNLDDK